MEPHALIRSSFASHIFRIGLNAVYFILVSVRENPYKAGVGVSKRLFLRSLMLGSIIAGSALFLSSLALPEIIAGSEVSSSFLLLLLLVLLVLVVLLAVLVLLLLLLVLVLLVRLGILQA